MNREGLLKGLRFLSWELKGTKETGSLISVRAGKVYIIGRSSKGGFRLTIRDYLRGDTFIECERLENELKETLDKLYWSNKALGTYKERYNKLRKNNIELRTKLYKSKKKLG